MKHNWLKFRGRKPLGRVGEVLESHSGDADPNAGSSCHLVLGTLPARQAQLLFLLSAPKALRFQKDALNYYLLLLLWLLLLNNYEVKQGA